MTRPSARPAVITIAHELRRLREERGLSLRAIARKTNISPAQLSALETGLRRQDATLVGYLLGVLGAPVATLKQLITVASRVDEPDYFDPTGDDESLLRSGFERSSTTVFEWSPTLFPKALHSAEYSRAVQESGLPNPDTSTRELVPASARACAENTSEKLYVFLLGEAATRPDACSANVLCDQIEEVATVSKLLRISVGLVPASFCPPGLVEPFTLYEDKAGPFAVAIPHNRGAAFLTNQASVTYYATTAKWLRGGIADAPWP
ncbi:transcriptional regulator with XRE-family HTH domain [Amycolatopsis sulphurea]|uniref:Transcriptional regulator with XRE-family HTH domain n=1 Tax=Amycolatopsis sulphurea TaxID=76022 RepID=A0A2A9FBY0_9PSEU|nr:Scr1 family TA system antitoxin-like transcriptional regulator [Amycolatopsis sulphurea]PFG48296.1 transcriptional regulator with XRE-family HTH domain [Amycolatopsis sulphurea]